MTLPSHGRGRRFDPAVGLCFASGIFLAQILLPCGRHPTYNSRTANGVTPRYGSRRLCAGISICNVATSGQVLLFLHKTYVLRRARTHTVPAPDVYHSIAEVIMHATLQGASVDRCVVLQILHGQLECHELVQHVVSWVMPACYTLSLYSLWRRQPECCTRYSSANARYRLVRPTHVLKSTAYRQSA